MIPSLFQLFIAVDEERYPLSLPQKSYLDTNDFEQVFFIGITMTDGPLWQEQRNFAERQLRQLGFGKMVMENLMMNELSTLLTNLGEHKEDITLNDKLSSSVLNVLWTITGGKQFSKDEDRLSELLSLLKERSRAFDMAGGILNQIPWLRFIMPEYSGYTCIKTLNAKLFDLFQVRVILLPLLMDRRNYGLQT